ncbi:MAG TPA: cohesin domain-containing protein [Candidatus Desulfaltia sp.]|nr:cohesin domain-containing protein [Candidatus Desulfaltia sp.]
MTFLKHALTIGLLTILLFLVAGCKKNPTTTSIEVTQPIIDVVCEPSSGAADTTITVSILIAGNTKEMRVFGLDVNFDAKMLQSQEVHIGTLTGSWAAVNGNEVSPGSLKVGGFFGAGTPIPAASQGTLAEIKFKVTGSEYGNGQQSQVCARQYTDDLSDFQPESACAVFTLKK